LDGIEAGAHIGQLLARERLIERDRTSPGPQDRSFSRREVREHQEFVVGGYQGDRTRPDKAARDVHREEI
jgi:hypothetical protein